MKQYNKELSTTIQSDSNIISNAIDVVSNQLPDKDSELIKDLGNRISRIKLNSMLRKKLAHKLSVDEKKALSWETASDALACIDTCQMAKEHPHDAAGIVRTVVSIVSIFVPVIYPISRTLYKMDDDKVAKIAMYCGTITPEHLINLAVSAKIEEINTTEEEALELYKKKKIYQKSK